MLCVWQCRVLDRRWQGSPRRRLHQLDGKVAVDGGVARSGRDLVWLPLGTFDVWKEEAQRAIEYHAQMWWPAVVFTQETWSVLAATGGRPRDISVVLSRLNASGAQPPQVRVLLEALFVPDPEDLFQRYLLPSMLDVVFHTRNYNSGMMTQFGHHAASSALLNADQLANRWSDVPAVSLGHAGCLRRTDIDLFLLFEALISSTTFYELNGGA